MTTAWWRGVGPTHNVFVVESFIDELAALAGADAVAFRQHLRTTTRVRARCWIWRPGMPLGHSVAAWHRTRRVPAIRVQHLPGDGDGGGGHAAGRDTPASRGCLHRLVEPKWQFDFLARPSEKLRPHTTPQVLVLAPELQR